MALADARHAWDMSILALCLWREARGETLATKQAVAWSIRNRVLNPKWWGYDWQSVILMPFQYSSFNRTDPNATKFPTPGPAWDDCLTAASQVWTPFPTDTPVLPDPTGGANSYFDMSLDSIPPDWSKAPGTIHTIDSGRLHFYKLA